MMSSTIKTDPKKTIVKIMVSHESKAIVFNFFEETKNIEIGGAINNVIKDIDDWYTFNHITAGNSRLKIVAKDRELGVLDHLFEGGGLSWIVYVRIINNGSGSTTTWTFLQPDELTEIQFEEQLKGFDREIENWNRYLSTSIS